MTPETLRKVTSTCWDWDELRTFCFSQALRVVGCPDTADEAAQEAIMRAWRHQSSCRRPDQPFGWLRRIARNEAVRVASQRPNEVLVDEPHAWPDERSRDDDGLENRLLFSGILGTLSREDQELARLRYYEDMTCGKIAEHFGLSEAAVKVRLHRLRQRIRQRMEAQI